MADPRGLSAAVFSPAPVRDFTQDLLLREKLGAEKAKEQQEELSSISLDDYKFGEINNPKHSLIFENQMIPEFKELSKQLVMTDKNSPKYRELKRKHDKAKADLISFPKYSRAYDALASKNHELARTNKLGEESAGLYNTQTKYFDELIGEGGVVMGEDGSFLIDGEPISSVFNSAMRFSQVPEEYDYLENSLDLYDGILNREGRFDRNSAMRQVSSTSNSPRYQKNLLEHFKAKYKGDEETARSVIDSNPEAAMEDYNEFIVEQLRTRTQERAEDTEDEGGGLFGNLSRLGVSPVEGEQAISIYGANLQSNDGKTIIADVGIKDGKIVGTGYKAQDFFALISKYGDPKNIPLAEKRKALQDKDSFVQRELNNRQISSLNSYISSKTGVVYDTEKLKQLIKEISGDMSENQQTSIGQMPADSQTEAAVEVETVDDIFN